MEKIPTLLVFGTLDIIEYQYKYIHMLGIRYVCPGILTTTGHRKKITEIGMHYITLMENLLDMDWHNH